MAGSVPVIDMSPLHGGMSGRDAAAVIARIDDACAGTGFFVLIGHGMEGDVGDVFGAASALFTLPVADKAAMAMQQRCGYVDDGAKEMFDIAYDPERTAPNRWPDVAGFRPLVERYQMGALGVAATLLRALAVALGVDPAFFADRMHRPECFLRMLHYPPRPAGDVTTRAQRD